MTSSQDELNKSLLKQLECPVCLETCTPPIRMCVRSHIVCSECAKDLKECATCRQPMAAERNWFAEDLCSKVKLPCKHVENGCYETFDLNKLDAHLPDCAFKNYDCLIGGNFDNGIWENVCEWKGPEYELIKHVEETHVPAEDYLKKNKETSQHLLTNTPLFEGNLKPNIKLMSAYDSLFWKISCFWSKSREIEVFVLLIGSKEKSAKFQYRYDIGEENGGKLSFHSPIVPCSLDERVGKTLKIGEGMRGFLNAPDGKLRFKLTILEKK